jgi:hypothetical protein
MNDKNAKRATRFTFGSPSFYRIKFLLFLACQDTVKNLYCKSAREQCVKSKPLVFAGSAEMTETDSYVRNDVGYKQQQPKEEQGDTYGDNTQEAYNNTQKL